MFVRTITGAILALIVGAGPVLACQGEEIFSDDFADPILSKDLWGIGTQDWLSVEKGYLQIKVKPTYSGFTGIPQGQNEFDVCVDITYPEAKNPDGGTSGGIYLWFKDWDNYYDIATTPVGGVGVFRVAKGKTTQVSQPFKIYDQVKKGAGAVNTFRVTLKGNTGTIYANGQRLTAFRVVASDAQADGVRPLSLYAHSEQDQENAWRFGNLKLTEPPK
jgi:hypothetical protein